MNATTRFRNILFPTDLSPDSAPAFDHARFLAEHFRARLTLFHAVEVPDPRFAHWDFAHGHDVWLRAEAEARAVLDRHAASLPEGSHVVVLRAASVHRALVGLIRSAQPDLTVMATHGREGLSHLLLGSVTEQVIRQVHRPILCIRPAGHGGGLPYRRILVPTDFSPASRFAFPIAAALGRAFEAEILATHVLVPQAPELRTEASLWKFFQADFAPLAVTAQISSGTVWERIVHMAGVERADLVVMSTRGHDSLADRVLGSNTDRVVRHAPCPVLVA